MIFGGNGGSGSDTSGGGGGGGAAVVVLDGVSITTSAASAIVGGGGGGGAFSGAGGGGGGGGDAVAFLGSGALVHSGLIIGGRGGSGGENDSITGGGHGGGGGSGVSGAVSITNSGTIRGGVGGGGTDGGGGDGGSGVSGALSLTNSGTVEGGGGGSGGGFGAGGRGGSGVSGTSTVTNSGTIRGGTGGGGDFGSGNQGGSGVSGATTLTNFGTIQGGTGGTGTNSGGSSGEGGVGVFGTSFITNAGTIQGGDGGDNNGGVNGRGGAGIVGSNLTIINSGSISGGMPGQGLVSFGRADAITFTGGSDTLTLQGTSWSLTGNLAINGGGSLTFDQAIAQTLGNIITGNGSVIQNGAGTLTLTGANTYIGGTTISTGTLQIGNGGTTGSIVGNVTDNATLAFNRSDAVTFGGAISGSGGVNQIGSGTTTLTGTNTYTGTTIVSAGTLVLASAASITSNVTNAATFQNSGTVTATVSNANTFDNAATGVVSGRVTNTVGTSTNAGALNGGVTVSGGTFTQTGGSVGGGLSNAATVNANGGAINGAIANAAGTFSVGGTVTSDSTFDNAGGATLAIGAAGNYTLQGLLTNSGVITVASGGQLDATVGGITNAAGGSLNVAVGGTVKDDLNNAGTVTNNGAYLANVATNTGIITNNSVWTGNVASSAGTITNNLTWNGAITTSGTFTNSAGATVTGLVTNSGTGANLGTLSGGLTLTGGTFNNAGTIAGAVTVSGGSLFGTGSIGTLNIANGGTFAAGDGTAGTSTTIAGSLAFASGAIYLVQVNPTTSSYSTVTGTAMLGGATVSASFAGGSYVEKQYMILTAGSISGTFNPTVANIGLPSGFKTTLSYDGTHAYLDLAIGFVAPSGTGLSGNQQNVGNALVNFFNSNGSIPIVFGSLTPAGLTQLSGELGGAPQQTTFNAMSQFMGLLTDPLTGRGNGINGATSAPGYAEESSASAYAARRTPKDAFAMFSKAPPIPFVPRWSVWAAGYGGSQTTDGNALAGSNRATSNIFGTAVGADYQLSPNTLAGFALAGGGTNFSVSNLGSGRSDLFQAAAYMRHTNGATYVTGALAYGWQDITTNRTVTVAGLDQLRAEFKANAWSGRLEGGFRFVAPWLSGVGITPYAAGQFTTFDLPAYAESVVTGTANFALAYAAKSVTAPRSELGLRTDKSFAMTDGILTLRGRLAWAHDFSPDRSIGAIFQSLPGASFVVNGAAQARDSALTAASAEMKWANGWSAAATFEGEFSNVTRSYAGKAAVRYAW
ncbi:autotransporter domain-containing protein [Bradyrhizobium sp. STM 3566]|uniref:autotransporter domain-containing protein n=1 Tax=Bradyrhizobium sp. STM 3566 TaxID=578928 RepID=UPI00388F5ACE